MREIQRKRDREEREKREKKDVLKMYPRCYWQWKMK